MTDNVYGNVAGFYKSPAWHQKGTVFQTRKTTVEAGEEIGLFYPIDLETIYYRNAAGKLVEIPKRKAVVRKAYFFNDYFNPEEEVYEVVSDIYSLVQNRELAEYFEPLSKIYGVETIGALGKGEKIFISLDMGDILINGDLTHQNLLIVDDKTGKEATKLVYTPVRVVCQNTLVMGLKQATMTVNILHKTGNKQKINSVAQMVEDIKKRVDFTNSIFGDMSKVHFDLDEFKQLLKYLYTIPEPEGINVTEEFEKARQKKQQEQNIAVEIFNRFNDEHPNNGNNGWGAYNAIVEKEDWGMQVGTRISNLPESTLFGSRAQNKIKAFNYIIKG